MASTGWKLWNNDSSTLEALAAIAAFGINTSLPLGSCVRLAGVLIKHPHDRDEASARFIAAVNDWIDGDPKNVMRNPNDKDTRYHVTSGQLGRWDITLFALLNERVIEQLMPTPENREALIDVVANAMFLYASASKEQARMRAEALLDDVPKLSLYAAGTASDIALNDLLQRPLNEIIEIVSDIASVARDNALVLAELQRLLTRRSQPRSFPITDQPRPESALERLWASTPSYPRSSALDIWQAFFTDEDSRLLVIAGPRGRGKTVAAKQLRQRILTAEQASIHLWFDCSYRIPRRADWAALFGHAWSPTDPKMYSEAVPSVPDFDFVSPLLAGLASPMNGGQSPRCFVYLDNIDDALDELNAPRSFLATVLANLTRIPALRIVATCAHPTGGPAVLAVINKILGPQGLQSMAGDLVPLDDVHVEEFLGKSVVLRFEGKDQRRDAREYLDVLIDMIGGEPLTMTLLSDVVGGIGGGRHDKPFGDLELDLLKELAHPGTTPTIDAEAMRTLAPELYSREVARLTKDAFDLALATAVLTYDYPPVSEARSATLAEITGLQDLSQPWKELEQHHLVPEGSIEADGPRTYRLVDSARDYIYEAESAKEERGQLPALHRRVALFYEALTIGGPDHDAPTLASWNALAAWHWLAARHYENALATLESASPDLEAAFLFADLYRLRCAVDEMLMTVSEDAKAHAENDAQLAEVEYQGFDRYDLGDEAWRRAAQVVSNFRSGELGMLALQRGSARHPSVALYEHENALAYAQSRVMLAVVAFEATSSPPSGALVTDAEDILTFIDENVRDQDQRPDEALRATVLADQGVFYNRGGMTDKAVGSYNDAWTALATVEERIPLRARERLRPRVDRDRLRVLVNQSRSVFLAKDGGPAAALQLLVEPLEKSGRGGTQEQLYGWVNAAYYHLQLGDFGSSKEYVQRCNDLKQEPAGRLSDKWIFDNVAALEAALILYTGASVNVEGVVDHTRRFKEAGAEFERLSKEFDYSRDRALMNMNKRVVDLSELMEPGDRDGVLAKGLETLCSLLAHDMSPVADEPIAADTVRFITSVLPAQQAHRSVDRGENVDPEVRMRTVRRFGSLMFGDGGDTGPIKRLPVMMRGALILRSRPLAPLVSELDRLSSAPRS